MECWLPTGTPERTAGNTLLWNDQFGRTGLVFYPASFQISVVLAEVLSTVTHFRLNIREADLDFRNLAEIHLFPPTGLRGRTPWKTQNFLSCVKGKNTEPSSEVKSGSWIWVFPGPWKRVQISQFTNYLLTLLLLGEGHTDCRARENFSLNQAHSFTSWPRSGLDYEGKISKNRILGWCCSVMPAMSCPASQWDSSFPGKKLRITGLFPALLFFFTLRAS